MAGMPLRWTKTKEWNVARFEEANLEHVDDDTTAILAFIADLPTRSKLAVSFRGVEWISSRVIGLLVASKKAIEGKKGSFAITSPGPKIVEVLKITRLDRTFVMKESTNDLP
jgi:anti-anti-sigma factor